MVWATHPRRGGWRGWLLVAAQNHGGVDLAIGILDTANFVANRVRRSDVFARQRGHSETLTLAIHNTVDGTGTEFRDGYGIDGRFGAASFAHAN